MSSEIIEIGSSESDDSFYSVRSETSTEPASGQAPGRRRLRPVGSDTSSDEAGEREASSPAALAHRGERERVSALHRRCQYIDDEAEETDAEASEEEEETQADRDFIDDGDEDDGSAEEETEDEENSSDADSECRKPGPDGMGCDDAPSQVCASLRDRFCEAFERLQWQRHDPSNWQELQYPRPITSTKAALPQHARKHDVMRRSPPEESVGRTQSPHWETAIVDEVDEEDEDETIFLPKSAIKPKSTAAKSKTRLLEDCDEADEGGRRDGQKEKEQIGADIAGGRETTTPRRRLQPVSSSSDDDAETGKDLDVSVVAPRQKEGANENYGAATDEVVSSDEQAIVEERRVLEDGVGGLVKALGDLRVGGDTCAYLEEEEEEDIFVPKQQGKGGIKRAGKARLLETCDQENMDVNVGGGGQLFDPKFLSQFYADHVNVTTPAKTPKARRGEGREKKMETPSKDGPKEKIGSSTPAQRGRRDAMTHELFLEMNERIFEGKLPHDLEIRWNARLNTTAGITVFQRAVGGASGNAHGFNVRVELSTKVLDDTYKLTQTLCHELCHVAAWVVDHTRKPPHGSAFRRWAALAARRYPGMEVTTCHNYEIAYKYRWQCQDCHAEYGRHSKSIDVDRQVGMVDR